MKKLYKFLFSTQFMLALAFFANVAIYIVCAIFLDWWYYGIFAIFALLIALTISKNTIITFSNRIAWAIVVIIMPFFGLALYYYTRGRNGTKKERKTWQEISNQSEEFLEVDSETETALKKNNVETYNQCRYITNFTGMPVNNNSSIKYFNEGDKYFDSILNAIKKAKKYVFVESYRYKQGKVWDELFAVLKQKAREGVEIKFLYDDEGNIGTFDDKRTFFKLENHLIIAKAFNKIKLRFNLSSSNRDHRRMVVIDGVDAYFSSMDFSDESANIVQPYGYFKDVGIKVSGKAVWNLTVLFLTNWKLTTNEEIDYASYKPEYEPIKSKEYILPFGANPITIEPVTKNVYINAINSAKESIIITTPYLILDNEINSIIKLASKKGIDVKIVVPNTPKVKWQHNLSKTYFADLIRAGVQICEYLPGYIHCNMLVVDNATTIISTANMDFRHMYKNYECSVLIYNSNVITDIRRDLETAVANSHVVTLRDLRKRKWHEKLHGVILRNLKPMM